MNFPTNGFPLLADNIGNHTKIVVFGRSVILVYLATIWLKNAAKAPTYTDAVMRKNLPVTQREVRMREGGRLITTTDLKGVITYCNDEFAEISGFRREELIGQAHNIIRHYAAARV